MKTSYSASKWTIPWIPCFYFRSTQIFRHLTWISDFVSIVRTRFEELSTKKKNRSSLSSTVFKPFNNKRFSIMLYFYLCQALESFYDSISSWLIMTKQKRTQIREIRMLPVNDSGSGIKLSLKCSIFCVVNYEPE